MQEKKESEAVVFHRKASALVSINGEEIYSNENDNRTPNVQLDLSDIGYWTIWVNLFLLIIRNVK